MIETRRLRELELEPGSTEGGKSFIAAASGLVHTGSSLCVIADDALDLAVFPGEGEAPGRLAQLLRGELSSDQSQRKAHKPDFEALTSLPAFEGHPNGALMALESGSKGDRHYGVVCPLAPDGALSGERREIELAPLYEELKGRLPELNVEGAPVAGERILLMQRGNGPARESGVIELSLELVLAAITRGGPLDGSALVRIRRHDLGAVDGVPLCFSDAAPLPDGRLVYSAVAEGEGKGHDGAFGAAVVGMIEPDGTVSAKERLEPAAKVEGVEARVREDGAIELLLVADADDPDQAAPLLAATLRP
ncbi:MAG: hypothetical protein H0V03_02670 [Thermoleophilaceae bacterium]|nr:hypothetical protein [Thermoleophilaceae bacterium]